MRRRTFITASAAVTALLAGCSSVSEFAGGQTSPAIGEAATYEGVEVTPRRYFLTDKVTHRYGGNAQTHTAPDGATYLYTEMHFAHKGDAAVSFPRYGLGGGDAIEVMYRDDSLPEVGIAPPEQLSINDKQLQLYSNVYMENAQGDVYPGTELRGWIGKEIAANFTPADVELRVTWNNQPFGGDDETTQSWTYTADGKVDVEDVEGLNQGSTIEI